MQHTLSVDLSTGVIELGDVQYRLRGRWDRFFLACLAEDASGFGIDAARLQVGLSAQGLVRALAPIQLSRLLDRVGDALQFLSAELPVRLAIQHPSRSRTRGPWRIEGGLVAIQVLGRQAPVLQPFVSPAEVFSLTEAARNDSELPFSLALRMKRAVEAFWNADIDRAIGWLADDASWAGESAALCSLRRLRLAEFLVSRGDYAQAQRILDALADSTLPDLVRRLLQPHLNIAQLRLRYAADPLANHGRIGARIGRALADPSTALWQAPDSAALAEHLHLQALCQRRRLEADDRPAHHPSSRAQCQAMLQSFHAAFLLCLVARDHERAQHVCANLAYAHQRLFKRDPAAESDVHRALEWHGLSFALHTCFGGSENSAWEYIFLGELWLESSVARDAVRGDRLRLLWHDRAPDTLAFYEAACEVARQTADPRQIGYTLNNRSRFLQHTRDAAGLRKALPEARRWFEANPAVLQLLQAEGYVVPLAG